ncbi:MAG TPA: division/cell wall cluster transcriptional repressor MraZ [Bacteroidetes bacterium]|nr:division/cell wall cluster transcriptional repressor MraZ [Bacteroidota bacterium]
MQQLLGEYECKIDAKGRMRMPPGLIGQLGEEAAHNFVINRGFEKCLMLYPEPVWDRITNEINQLNLYTKKNRDFVRYFMSGATELTLDASERVLLPKPLQDYANITKELVLSAFQGKVEVWDKKQYHSTIDMNSDDFAGLAEEVMGNTPDE